MKDKGVLVKNIIADNNLSVIYGDTGLDRVVLEDMICRPGMELCGYLDFYEPQRIVLLGTKETTFLKTLDLNTQKERVNNIFNLEPPLFVISKNVVLPDYFIELAKKYNASVEAEVGSIGGEEDGVVGMGEFADPEECKKIASLGIDMLAAGIGNIHGVYPENWPGLNFDVLEQIKEKCPGMPLVLHGGTGIPEDMIKEAISLGVCKINVNTECQLAFAAATRKYIEEGKDQVKKGFDPRKLLAPGTEAIKELVKQKMTVFGSVGKAE